MAGSVGIKTPYRYRRYRYDTETKLYYLQSRYYNPEWGRFVNADGITGLKGQLLSHNIFAYCNNNSINMSDHSGFIPLYDDDTQYAYYKNNFFQYGTTYKFNSQGEVIYLDNGSGVKNMSPNRNINSEVSQKSNNVASTLSNVATVGTTAASTYGSIKGNALGTVRASVGLSVVSAAASQYAILEDEELTYLDKVDMTTFNVGTTTGGVLLGLCVGGPIGVGAGLVYTAITWYGGNKLAEELKKDPW